jgi:hypothetical protein
MYLFVVAKKARLMQKQKGGLIYKAKMVDIFLYQKDEFLQGRLLAVAKLVVFMYCIKR